MTKTTIDPKKRGILAAALMASGSLLLASCGGHGGAPQPTATGAGPIAVSVAPIRTASFSTPVELSGTLTAVRSVTVGAISAGRIVAVDVRVGDRVSAGQVLAQVDTSGYSAGLAQAQAGASAAAANQRASQSALQAAAAAVDGAKAQLASAESHRKLAQTTADRMSALYAAGAISKQQEDETQANLAAARAGVTQAKAGVAGATNTYQAATAQASAASDSAAQARAGVTAASVPLRDATLTAPFSGVITSKFVDPGAVVGPGSPVVALQNTHDLELDVAVPEDDVAGLAPGQGLSVRVDAVGGKGVPGHVRAIVPSENPALRSATVKIAVDDRPSLMPGMFARVSFSGGAHEGMAVPLGALVTRAGQSGIFVVRDGTATFVPVQTGTITGSMVEVRGVEDRNASVAVSNLQRLTEGASVTVSH
ncbi:MAG TPA: efflux RND transporter periplasmic adaptor subunit [Candidatus Dormibacteraeota bacterium]|nr:efflux RND transporter periplasmic adaptor subunit [Candidatus Dormibacteraeota bacterium]